MNKMSKRSLIVIAGGLICMSIVLYMVSEIIDSWETVPFVRKAVKLLALAGWCWITYNVITLKYKFLKRLTGKQNK